MTLFNDFSKSDRQKLVKFARERGRQPLFQRNTQRRKDLEPLRLFPVLMEQTGGSDGTQTTAASWTYTITDALSDEELDTAHNPLTAPSMCKNPIAPGRVVAATAGLAFFNDDGELCLWDCNHAIAGAPCG